MNASATLDSPLAVEPSHLVRRILRLAYPVLIVQALLYLVGFSDTLLAGLYLSEDHLAAVTVSGYLMWFLSCLVEVVSAGATAIVARRIGENERGQASRVTRTAVVLAGVLGVSILIVGTLASETIVRMMNLTGTSAEEAVGYLRVVLLALPLLACEMAGNACLRGAGDTRTGMWINLLMQVVHIPLSWFFVTGAFGAFPSFGLRGIAAGTAISESVGGLLMLAVLAQGRAGLCLRGHGRRSAWDDVRRILRISLPATGESLTLVLCQLWFLGMINRLGATATAAHGVAVRCEALAFLTLTAFSVAASTLTGQYLGARRPDLAARAARTAWLLGVALMTSLGLFFFVFAEPMFALFLGGAGRKQAVLEAGVPALRIVSLALPALATINVLSGALRGAGDTRWPWLFVVIGFLGVRLPLTEWLIAPHAQGGFGLALTGAWIAMSVDLLVRAALVGVRFARGRWKEIRV